MDGLIDECMSEGMHAHLEPQFVVGCRLSQGWSACPMRAAAAAAGGCLLHQVAS